MHPPQASASRAEATIVFPKFLLHGRQACVRKISKKKTTRKKAAARRQRLWFRWSGWLDASM